MDLIGLEIVCMAMTIFSLNIMFYADYFLKYSLYNKKRKPYTIFDN